MHKQSEVDGEFVLGEEVSGELDILGLSGLLGLSLEVVPGFPLGLSLEVQHAGLGGVVVSNATLLVKAVDLQQLVVGHCDAGASGGLDLISSFLEGGHYGYVTKDYNYEQTFPFILTYA